MAEIVVKILLDETQLPAFNMTLEKVADEAQFTIEGMMHGGNLISRRGAHTLDFETSVEIIE